MVFESIVAELLNRFLGDYVENLDQSQLKIGIWGGKRNVRVVSLRQYVGKIKFYKNITMCQFFHRYIPCVRICYIFLCFLQLEICLTICMSCVTLQVMWCSRIWY